MRYREFAVNEHLPGRVATLLDKPHIIALKDGRTGVLQVSAADANGNKVAPGEVMKQIIVAVVVDGVHAGSLHIAPNRVPQDDEYANDRGSWSTTSVLVNNEFRRQGIASAMYDVLASAGMKILPSGGHYGGKLSPDGAALWQTNRPPLRLGQQRKPQRFWTPRKKM